MKPGPQRDPLNGVEILQCLLGFGNDEKADVIFAAIDFEGTQNIENAFPDSRCSEFGVAYLDTRDLLSLKSHKDPASLISTKAFATGTDFRWYRVMKNYRYGTPERISVYDLREKVRESLSPEDATTSRPRKVVLVSHRHDEMRRIHALRLQTKPSRNDLSSICHRLKVSGIANELAGKAPNTNPKSLEKLSVELGLPCEPYDFHTAGNDANCTLRILLLLAVKSQERKLCTDEETRVIDLLRKVAKSTPPPRKSAAEIERLLAVSPDPLDDPEVPIDPKSFSIYVPWSIAKVALSKKKLEKRRAKIARPGEIERRAAIKGTQDDDSGYEGSRLEIDISELYLRESS